MAARLEIGLKPGLVDPEGEGLKKKAAEYFGYDFIEAVRTIRVLTIDADLSEQQLTAVQHGIFTNPVTEFSSFQPLAPEIDLAVWVGLKPGVNDTAGHTALEAIRDYLGYSFKPGEDIYTSKIYLLATNKWVIRNKAVEAAKVLASEILANDIIQQWRVFDARSWDKTTGIGLVIPQVRLQKTPSVTIIPIGSDAELARLSQERNLALNENDIPTIRNYFLREEIRTERAKVGLDEPTDVELEYISQGRSDHCNHNTFNGIFNYTDLSTGQTEIVDNLFTTCIKAPTLAVKAKKPWVVSVLWDNAGIGRFDEDHYYVITGETHNSPSNMEAYGGAITGIVGVYRDPMGTGLGAKLVMGAYGYCVGPRDYPGPLQPHLHPRRLLDGVITGVKDGGNKSGIPTPFGQVFFHPNYLGKCLVFGTALGIMPAQVQGRPAEQKSIDSGDLIIMAGGRVGKDGIHGVTASSEVYSEHTPAGHVQIGDPYTQKKMSDFLIEARDEGLISFITDNGGGGLSSSVGESARVAGGCEVDLDQVPLKYAGLDQWEIWVSESQERMTIAVKPDHRDRFMELAAKHEVESTVIGTFIENGKLHLRYDGQTCAYVDIDFLESGFPRWEFQADWHPPTMRGLTEPVLSSPSDHNAFIQACLARPNICSKEWITRQYDHEVQGGSVIKPLIGPDRDIPADAVVLRPVLTSSRGLAYAQAINPTYSQIDAYHMTAAVIDEAVRRVLAVGGDLDHIGGVDNFCWPNIQYHPQTNPDGKFKAAQLVRANLALRDCCLAFGIPLLSGKDSMYVDGNLAGRFGERHKISGPETLQFTTVSVVQHITQCQTPDVKFPNDLVYILGLTKDELGGSEYYAMFDQIGLNVPQLDPAEVLPWYQTLAKTIADGLPASVHGIYRGGLAVHAAFKAMAGHLGLELDLSKVQAPPDLDTTRRLYSESLGRFLITIDPAQQGEFEHRFTGQPLALIGRVTERPALVINDGQKNVINLGIAELKTAWKSTFGHLA
ncbi:MAG: phosphoribosylformylglycinamidine synthase subunit PurS [Deltaproteobacteria bacterium]|nr:phosphoribosylformylglycinamidine synthase subunit PurS [Deltaproteobacteria bacterium]